MNSDEELPEEGDKIKLNKLLKDSVLSQNFKRTSFYLEKGADASLRVNIDAGNLLHHNKDPQIAALLISKGAKVDARNRFRLTPLLIAVTENNYELVKVLLQHGADVHCFNKRQQNTPLNIAVRAGDLKLVKLLLKHGSVVNDQTNSFSDTPLHIALSLRNINVKIVNLLLENGADVNLLNFHKEGPIHVAVKNCHCPLHIIKKLLSQGALINIRDSKGGCTPLQYALDNDNYEVVKLLLKHGADIHSRGLHSSSDLHADCNVLHSYLFTAHAKFKIVKLLLKHSCTFEVCYANALTSDGYSPLSLANMKRIDINIIKELLNYNADPFITLPGNFVVTLFELTLCRTVLEEQRLTKASKDEKASNYKELTMQVMKWFIKYGAMKSKEHVCFMKSKLEDQYYYSNFLNKCLVELPLIEQELGISLNAFLKPASMKNTFPNHIVDKIAQILTTSSFPIYKEVVAAILKKSDLLNRLKCEIFCINTENRRTYFLNWTISGYFLKYLSTQDLLNLFVAFFTRLQK